MPELVRGSEIIRTWLFRYALVKLFKLCFVFFVCFFIIISTCFYNIFLPWCFMPKVMMMGSTAVAELLLAHGANPNVADRSTGSTPLHDAARMGFVDTVRLLVDNGADPQARDMNNCRPVDLAREHGCKDVVAFLEGRVLLNDETEVL